MRARLSLLLAALLALSVALDAYLATRLLRASRAADHAAASPPAAAPAPSACAPVHAELNRCRAEGWSLLSRALAGERRAAATEAPKDAPSRGLTTLDRQHRELYDMAEDQLRQKWEQEREGLTQGLRRDLVDPEKQRQDAVRDAEKLGAEIGLDPAAQKALTDAYLPLRQARIADAAAAMQSEPPDYGAVLDAAHGLLSDEDALVGRMYGDDAQQKMQASELRGRTSLLAILATLAGRSWDEAVRP